MNAPDELEAFCALAEAWSLGVSIGFLEAPALELTLSSSDMTVLAGQIRALQSAARDNQAHVWVGAGTLREATTASAADPDGWIEWNGGTCPVLANAYVEVRLRSKKEWSGNHAARAEVWRWEHDGGPGDIVAYRLVSQFSVSVPPSLPDIDGFYGPKTKPALPGVYRTWFLFPSSQGFSYWNGTRWGHEHSIQEQAFEHAQRERTYGVNQNKYWKPVVQTESITKVK